MSEEVGAENRLGQFVQGLWAVGRTVVYVLNVMGSWAGF